MPRTLFSIGLGSLLTALLVACAAPTATPGATADAGHATVRTTAGLVRGAVSADGAVNVFKGVPYAAPPVGALRWQAPKPPLPWSGVRDALEAGSPCPQSGRLASTHEDCLHLYITAPRVASTSKLPVMVFLHGGGQRQSAAHEYNADRLVTRGQPVVYVGVNYRLNIFAFYAHPALSAEVPGLGSGNYAALDQIQALRWVRDNIAAFGGDPENVTLFGESGGAQAVCVLLASPPARGLFHKAISQSAPCQWQLYPSLTASEERGALMAAEFGCKEPDPLLCLRALPASAVLAKERGATTDTAAAQPAWGGGVFPLPMREAMASGRFNRVPVMQGSNRDEGLFQLTPPYEGRGNPVQPAQYPVILKQYFGSSRVPAIERQYPLADFATPTLALVAALSDSGMVTNNRIGLCNLDLANQLAAPHVPVFAYEFADRTAPYPAPIFDAPSKLVGAAHTKELSYLFNQNPLTPAQQKVADAMIGYWTAFAATGNPNSNGRANWPAYRTEQPMVMTFNADGAKAEGDFYARHKCRFWAEQGFSSLAGPYPTATSSGPDYQ